LIHGFVLILRGLAAPDWEVGVAAEAFALMLAISQAGEIAGYLRDKIRLSVFTGDRSRKRRN
jgi:hypothetical protein